jgi:hypothetical protein
MRLMKIYSMHKQFFRCLSQNSNIISSCSIKKEERRFDDIPNVTILAYNVESHIIKPVYENVCTKYLKQRQKEKNE